MLHHDVRHRCLQQDVEVLALVVAPGELLALERAPLLRARQPRDVGHARLQETQLFGYQLERGLGRQKFQRFVFFLLRDARTQRERREKVRRVRRVRVGDATGLGDVERRVQRRAQERSVRRRGAERFDVFQLAARVAEVAQAQARVRVGKVVVLAGARGRVRGRVRERGEDSRARRRVFFDARERFIFFRVVFVLDALADVLVSVRTLRLRLDGSPLRARRGFVARRPS